MVKFAKCKCRRQLQWVDIVPMNRIMKYGKIFNSLGVGFLGKIIWIESILVYSYSQYRPDTSDLQLRTCFPIEYVNM